MLPWIYGFHWDLGHLIFLGAFYTVVLTVVTTVLYAGFRARRNMESPAAETIRWKQDFHDLPARDRRCRHELTGEVAERVCPNGFDCRRCDEHMNFVKKQRPDKAVPADIAGVCGLEFPLDCLYHRGHTWVRGGRDGMLTIGLDAFAAGLLDQPDQIELPSAGTRLQVNGTAWQVKTGDTTLRILSPVDGQVIETGSQEAGWYLRVRPRKAKPDLRHLLRGSEAVTWMQKEIERMQLALPVPGLGTTVADGAIFLGRPESYSQQDWDALRAEMLLQL